MIAAHYGIGKSMTINKRVKKKESGKTLNPETKEEHVSKQIEKSFLSIKGTQDNVSLEKKPETKSQDSWECVFKLPLIKTSLIARNSVKEKIKEKIQQS